ncbi:MAG: hypothetical protein COV48_10030 [Elusimicrobia bacterium CG11_big_fil_rev_8_21_14_0_20_64_6]|nr:MAG: hypothetical protein COV48_10030 [Elusimicrobia bacterium CG11_big_fil_rev_8_21_14_0_20_64_6]
MTRALLAAFVLAPALALAARYDPGSDRAALRRDASQAHAAIVNATGLALEAGKVPAITAGLDEGLRLARLASTTAAALDAAARSRAADMEAGAKSGERAAKELAEPLAEQRRRWQRQSGEHAELVKKAEKLPDADKKEAQTLLDKAAGALSSAADALRPLEESLHTMSEQARAMKAARSDSLAPLVEISSAAASVNRRAEDLPEPAAAAKALLGSLGPEPDNAAKALIWEKFKLQRDAARLLFEAADRVCNRADDFRRASAAYERSYDAFEDARREASSGTAGARAHLDRAHKALNAASERIKKPAAAPKSQP